MAVDFEVEATIAHGHSGIDCSIEHLFVIRSGREMDKTMGRFPSLSICIPLYFLVMESSLAVSSL